MLKLEAKTYDLIGDAPDYLVLTTERRISNGLYVIDKSEKECFDATMQAIRYETEDDDEL